ncbi:mechanosensitive ion channel domain-containing protein [uncultured Tateyamaria sp.]|uniref:mechanosensitive ion channel family protein n=1 Tax=uncultured Tateyamaria sp. TaxID=455651 RepID=UPI00344DA611
MTYRTFIALISGAFLWMLCTLPMSAQAQGLTNLLPSSPAAVENDISEIMRTAAENGVSVVVIDSDGQVLTQVSEPAPHSATPASGSTLMGIQDDAVAFRSALFDRLLNLPDAFNEVVFILRAASPDGTIFAYVEALLISLALFAAGMMFETQIFGKRIAKRFVVARILENPVGYSGKMPFLMFRFVFGVVGILVSMAVAYLLGLIIFGPLEDSAMQFTVSLINAGYFLARIAAGIWRMILSPYLAQYRIPLMEDRPARVLHLWLSVGAALGFFTILFGEWIEELGLNYEVYVFLFSLMSFGVMLLNIAMVVVNGRTITTAILNGKTVAQASWVVRLLARTWAPLAMLYFLFAWGDQTFHLVLGEPLGVPLLAAGWAILTTIIVVYGVINFFIERSFERARALRERNALAGETPEAVQTRNDVVQGPRITSFEGLARRIAGILAFVAGSYAFVAIWAPESNVMGESWADRLLDIIVILFIGYIIYNVFRIWIDNKIIEEQGDMIEAELGDEGGGSSASRLATLLPLFRNFVLLLIILTIVLIVLMEMGINVGPLFAGAGIIGVAVGFGSQSLVRDIFSGAFFLFDDAFRKGEYIDVGGVKGTVEKISVRSFQLRHHLGALHTMPFGEIQVLTNYSRDWVIMKLPLRVTYDTNVERVRKLIKNLGVQLLDDPVIGDNFIQPLKSQGVIEMQDSAMIIRVKFMTKPGDQWLVRKKVYEEIRALFEREGIKFAHREVTVRLADGKTEDLTEEDRKAITAAAQASIEEDLLEDAMDGGDDR